MKKCLIVCWYGVFPDYFDIWKKSCESNPDYDFLIFTDQEVNIDAANIKVKRVLLSELKTLIGSKLKLGVALEKPYKLCDFRPAYGVIFEDYLVDYDYWGHCDIDQIFGKISYFLPDNTIKQYERINHNGHFSLYKNNEKINNLFRMGGSPFNWKEVFTNPENYAFDEFSGINLISKKNNIKELYNNYYADIDRRFPRYRMVNHKNFKNQIFILENSMLTRYVYDNEVIKKENFFYVHFQKKKPVIDEKINYLEKIVIGSGGIGNCSNICLKTFKDYNPYTSKIKELIQGVDYYFLKVKEYLNSSKKEKIIKLKQKGVVK